MIGINHGDLARWTATARHTSFVKDKLVRLTTEMSSGTHADLPRALGAQRERFGQIRNSLTEIDTFTNSGRELGVRLQQQQDALGIVAERSLTVSAQLLRLPLQPSQQDQVVAIQASESALKTMTLVQNTAIGGVHLFSGAKTDVTPLPDVSDLMTAVEAAVDLTQSPQDIKQQVIDFFMDPAGDYETTIYQGSANPAGKVELGNGQLAGSDTTALDPALRRAMAGAALGALAGKGAAATDLAKQKSMLVSAGEMLRESTGLVTIQAMLGHTQERVEDALTKHAAHRTVLTIEYNNLKNVDVYDVASRLQSVQTQLETHFTLTGRMSKLALVNYLR